MTSTVPGFLAWPLLVFMAAVVALRYAFCNTSLKETYLNHMLAFYLACNLFREQIINEFFAGHDIMGITITQQLSLVALNFALIEFLGFVTLWSGASPQAIRRRHRYYRLAAIILVPAFVIATSSIRLRGEGLDAHHAYGWNLVLALLIV